MSYAHSDVEHAATLAKGLTNAGLDIWRDVDHLLPGQLWTEKIVDAILSCDVLLLLASRAAFESYHVKKEIHIACDERKPIAPIMLTECEPPSWARYCLAGTHSLVFTDGCIPEIVDNICLSLPTPHSDSTGDFPHPPTRPTHRDICASFMVLDHGRFCTNMTIDKDVISIGRSRTCDIVPRAYIPSEEQKHRSDEITRHSRTHAYVRWNGSRFEIHDVSVLGLTLNGHQLDDITPLHAGDVIAIGHFQLVYRTTTRPYKELSRTGDPQATGQPELP